MKVPVRRGYGRMFWEAYKEGLIQGVGEFCHWAPLILLLCWGIHHWFAGTSIQFAMSVP